MNSGDHDHLLPLNVHGHPAVTFPDVAHELARPRMDTLEPFDSKFDLVIVGGGYTGLSAALHAKQANPNYRVLLLEADHVGAHASGKSGGHVCGGFQAQEAEIFKTHGVDLGRKLLAVADQGPGLVRDLIARHKINCDVRDGYVVVNANGAKDVSQGGDFGIDPYPYVLGLAQAAREAGVKIVEQTRVTSIKEVGQRLQIQLDGRDHPVVAQYAIAAGGHAMGRTIPELKRDTLNRTVDLTLTPVITEPLPQRVIDAIMPEWVGQRYPSCDSKREVEYWTVDRSNRLIFGSRVAADADASQKRVGQVAADMFKRFPSLQEEFRKDNGRELNVSPFFAGETLNFTADLMPNVGQAHNSSRVLYVNGLGGHGIALGTLLGKEAVNKIAAMATQQPERGAVFDDFAKLQHRWTPAAALPRRLAAHAGVAYFKATTLLQKLRQPKTAPNQQ